MRRRLTRLGVAYLLGLFVGRLLHDHNLNPR